MRIRNILLCYFIKMWVTTSIKSACRFPGARIPRIGLRAICLVMIYLPCLRIASEGGVLTNCIWMRLLLTSIMHQHTRLADKVRVRPRHAEIIHSECARPFPNIFYGECLPIFRQQLRPTPQLAGFLPAFADDPEFMLWRDGELLLCANADVQHCRSQATEHFRHFAYGILRLRRGFGI